MRSENDIIFMQRALELAFSAYGSTRPNPMVGAVIVHNNNIIGEGYHIRAGEDHAELAAIKSAQGDLLSDSTIYVTLEPCSHYGRTPPCAKTIVEKGFKRVVIGVSDSSAKVSGKGIEILKAGGCEVDVGLMEDECRELNKRFFTYHEEQRPYIILKWAESKDGYIDKDDNRPERSGPNWISGEDERILVHKWRTEEHSILVGRNTVIKDNPSLTARLWEGRNPLRLVLSDSGSFPEDLNVFTDDEPLLLFSQEAIRLEGVKENIIIRDTDSAINEILGELYKREIQSVLVEGGANLLNQFIGSDMWDEARIFKGKVEFGSGLAAPQVEGNKIGESVFEKSNLIYLKHSLIK